MSDFPSLFPGGPPIRPDGSIPGEDAPLWEFEPCNDFPVPETGIVQPFDLFDLFGQPNYRAVNLWAEEEIMRLAEREAARRATQPAPPQTVFVQLPLPLGE